jgi:hypothetical protein
VRDEKLIEALLMTNSVKPEDKKLTKYNRNFWQI